MAFAELNPHTLLNASTIKANIIKMQERDFGEHRPSDNHKSSNKSNEEDRKRKEWEEWEPQCASSEKNGESGIDGRVIADALNASSKLIASSIEKRNDISTQELELDKIEKIKGLEQMILDFILECDEKGISLDISKVKLDFQPYSFISLKNVVERYIKLISFVPLDESDKIKASQGYVQRIIDKLINELPPFLKKYADYNYKHFFIDKIDCGIYSLQDITEIYERYDLPCSEKEMWPNRVLGSYYDFTPKGIKGLSSNAYTFTDYKGNFVDLMADVVYDMDGEEIFDWNVSIQLMGGAPTRDSTYLKVIEEQDSEFIINEEYLYIYTGYRETLSIFENGYLCRAHPIWFNYLEDRERYGGSLATAYFSLPMFRYYYFYIEKALREEFKMKFPKNERCKVLSGIGWGNREYYEPFKKFLKEKGIIDFDEKLESGELNFSYLYGVFNPIATIINQINSNLSDEKRFDNKYYEYLQDTIDEYTQILRDLKLQAIRIRQTNTLNNSNKEKQVPTKRKVYRRNSLSQQHL